MQTPPRCWKAHCGGRPNDYTMLSLAGSLYVMSGLRLTPTFHQSAASLSQRGHCRFSAPCFVKETTAIQSVRAKHQQAALREKGGPESGAVRPGWASVWIDSVPARNRVGWWTPAVPGKGGQVWLAERPPFSKAACRQKHFTLVSLLSGEESNASIPLNFTTSVSCKGTYIVMEY